MSYRSDRFEYRLASPEHSKQLLEIYESGDFKGNISVLYTRRPDPYQSLIKEGETVVLPIMIDKKNGRICAMGGCVIRKAYINGKVKNTGYLTGLKILPEYRKLMPHISEVYKYLYEQTKHQVDLYYTTILKENVVAQKLLEKKRKNMPEYKCEGDYTVYCFKTGAKQKTKEYVFEKGNTEGLDEFYKVNSKSFNFTPINMNLYGLKTENIYTLRHSNGEILAASALWNQQSYKQYIITGYGGIYKYIKKIPLSWVGYPNLPQENIPANYASVTMLSVKDNDAKVAEYFIKKLAEEAREYDFLMLGFFENNPLITVFSNIKHIKYQSKFYTVHWEADLPKLDIRPIDLEVGLL